MRIPSEMPRGGSRRRNVATLSVIVALIVALVAIEGLSGLYTNFLWFHSSGVGEIWAGVTLTKVLLVLASILVATGLFWGCLFLVDVVVARTLFLAPVTELVRRYQAAAQPRAVLLRSIVSLLLGLAFGAGTASQWQNWILFTHSKSFGTTDPQFHRDLSFFIFRLPFLSFLVDWCFGLLAVALIVTAAAYFLNGAIRWQGSLQVEPRAIAHLSLLGSLMALERAWAYFYVDRFGLDVSQNGYVQGAGYTDVHVRLPAMVLLAVVSLVAFALLAFNVYQRGWALPAVAFGLWAFLALALGAIYPRLAQALHVTPAQSSLERPYISRNISATNAAFGISSANVSERTFPANQDLTPGVLQQYSETLDAAQVWDPVYSLPTFSKLQAELGYYKLTNLTLDRYSINGQLTPVDIGVRSLNSSGVPSQTWVNTHLQYTHGYAAVVAPANAIAPSSGGNPLFVVGNVPVSSSSPSLQISQPAVYFAPGDEQYVIADSRQREVDYQLPSGQTSEGSYSGSGGIGLGSFFARAAFAVKLHDFNLLISNLVGSKSRLILIPDVRAEVQKALPFLRVDANPYAVIDHGRIEWVLDAYTTSAYYPYSEQARTDALGGSSALLGNYNYVRDAVKVVVDAFNGTMRFYTLDAKADPVIESYASAFPGLFHPLSSLATSDPVLLQHLRYPQDLLEVQSEMFGRYHITSASAFYGQSNAWDLSQTSTAANGSPSTNLPIGPDGSELRYSPIYELLQLPGDDAMSFDAIEPLVPYSQSDTLKTLSALMVADSSYANYGRLRAYVTPSGSSAGTGSSSGDSGGTIDGPGLANATILSDPDVSQKITLLDSRGSLVTLGTVQVLPIADSLLYVRPLYVSSTQTLYPTLQDVVVVYGKQVSLAPTLAGALEGIFGASGIAPVGSGTAVGGSGTTVPAAVRGEIAEASKDYVAAESALKSGDLAIYQQEIDAAGALIRQANSQLVGASSATTKKAAAATSSTGA